ncbi:MAG: malic enzyme-like NAD(P)-binding protein [Candidatus Micrarchaeia archaeon]
MDEATRVHKQLGGKIKIIPKKEITGIEDLALLYTPGVAKPCLEIAKKRELVYELTMKKNSVAIVTDGTRVLGLGNIGPEASLPVMEGKAMIMSQFANLDAFPICLNCRDEEEIIKTVKYLEPVFGLINLEDIETPKVFKIHERLTEEMNIPVFHDDQHGTAMVVLAGLINAMKVLGLKKDALVGIIGTGSAGYAIANLLLYYGFENLICFDSKGAIHGKRNDLEYHKEKLAKITNKNNFNGKPEALVNAQIIIAASKPGSIPIKTIQNMKKPNIVFALSNPDSEITLEQAKELKIDIFGSGRSNSPNQINNAVCFPGFIKSLLDLNIRKIKYEMYVLAAKGIAKTVENPTREKIIPNPFEKKVIINIKKEMEKCLG